MSISNRKPGERKESPAEPLKRAVAGCMRAVARKPDLEVARFLRITQTATHTGDLLGVAPTGRRVTLRGIAIYRIAEGKIAEAWAAETAWTQVLAEAATLPA